MKIGGMLNAYVGRRNRGFQRHPRMHKESSKVLNFISRKVSLSDRFCASPFNRLGFVVGTLLNVLRTVTTRAYVHKRSTCVPLASGGGGGGGLGLQKKRQLIYQGVGVRPHLILYLARVSRIRGA